MSRQNTKLRGVLEQVWHANTLIGIVLLGWFLLPFTSYFPQFARRLWDLWMVLLITFICIEIYFIRTSVLEVLDGAKAKSEGDLGLQAFRSGEDFDAYLAHRLRSADELKIIHISSFASSAETEARPGERQGRRYSAIVEEFVKSGKILRRVFCKTSNCEVFEWIMEDLRKYEHDRYFINFIDQINIDGLRTFGIMIIDDHEVCIGGLYKTDSQHPTISMTNTVLGKFFRNYFQYLLIESKAISTATATDWKYINELAENCRTAHKM